MKVIPTGYRVLVKMVELEQKSRGGIIIATDKEQKRQQAGAQFARIIDFGPSVFLEDESEDIRIGDLIMTVRYPGAQFAYDNEDWKLYRIINDDEIIAKVEDATEEDLPT